MRIDGLIPNKSSQKIRKKICMPLRLIKQKSHVIRNIKILSIPNLLVQFWLIVSSLILVRIYSPDDYGKLTVFSTLTLLLSILFGLRFHIAIVSAGTEHEAREAAKLAVLSTVAMFAIVEIVIFLGIVMASEVAILKDLGLTALAIPVFGALDSFANIATGIATRCEEYRLIGRFTLVKGILGPIFQILLGVLQFGYVGLVIGSLIGTLIAVCFFAIESFIRLSISGLFHFEHQSALRRLRHLPLQELPSTLMHFGTLSLLPFFVYSVASIEYLGSFGIASKLLSLPLSIMGGALTQVFFQTTSIRVSAPKMLLKTYVSGVKWIFIVASLVYFSLGFVLLRFSSTLLGNDWSDVPRILPYLIPFFWGQLIAMGTKQIYVVIGKTNSLLKQNLIYLILLVAILFICKLIQLELSVVIFFFGTTYALSSVVSIFKCARYIKLLGKSIS